MLHVLEQAKQIGFILLERVEDYIELVRLDVEIQRHHIVQRVLSYAITGLCSLIAFVFLGFAVIVSFWETDYRILVAWLVVAFYVLLAVIAFARARRHVRPEPAFSSVSREVQQDIQLLKEIL